MNPTKHVSKSELIKKRPNTNVNKQLSLFLNLTNNNCRIASPRDMH